MRAPGKPSHAPEATDGADVIPWVERLAGADSVSLSIGSIETSALADLEPAFQARLFESPWAWHLTVLYPATEHVRTFVIPESTLLDAPASRDYTTYEVVGDQITATLSIID